MIKDMNKKILTIYFRFALVLVLLFIGGGLVVSQITIQAPFQSENLKNLMGVWYVVDFLVLIAALGLLAHTLWLLTHPPYTKAKNSVSH